MLKEDGYNATYFKIMSSVPECSEAENREITKKLDSDGCEKGFQNKINDAVVNMLNYSGKGIGKKSDVKRLKGKYKGYLRLRIGSYRMIFTVDYGKPEIFILYILPRDEAYK